MSYEKFPLLGLNKSGRTPVSRKPKPVHDVTQPIIADHNRDYEQKIGKTLATKSSVAKHHTLAVHSGMHFRDRGGTLNAGISHQMVTNAPDASGVSPMDPTVSKRLSPPQFTPGARSRVLMQEKFNAAPGVAHVIGQALAPQAHAHSHATGAKVWDEGLQFAGPDHPHNIERTRRGK